MDKSIIERPRTRGSHDTVLSYVAVFETARGKQVRLRLTPTLFEYYQEGRTYRKVAGLDYPVPAERGDQPGICPVCGKSYSDATTHCAGCRAPVLDFSHRAAAEPAPATALR